MTSETTYQHTQRSPLCLLLYAIAISLLELAWMLRHDAPILWTFTFVGPLMLLLAASFHHLTAKDEGDQLLITFGPIPMFRRHIRYQDIMSVEVGRTTLFDGWGIHLSLRGGWVWNIWGRDCLVIRLKNGRVLRLGTDDEDNLAGFLAKRTGESR